MYRSQTSVNRWQRWRLWIVISVVVACTTLHCGPGETPGTELVILPGQEIVVDTIDAGRPPLPRAEVRADEVPVLPRTEPVVDEPAQTDAGELVVPEQPVGPEPTPELSPEPSPERVTPEPPAPLQSWVGEPCTSDRDCAVPGGYCLTAKAGYAGGYCSAPCTGHCPDKAGKPVTFCIANSAGAGMCVLRCNKVACRQGYACEHRTRFQEASVQEQVCTLRSAPPTGNGTFLYIGDSQSSGSRFGSSMVGFLRMPRSSCPTAKSGSHKVYSYAKVSSASRHWSQASGSSKDWLCKATKVYVNGTAPANTTGAKLCAGITGVSKSIYQKLIETHKPSGFLVQLGGNSMGFAQSYVKGKIKAMLDLMPAGSLCFWVTPSASSSTHLAKRRDIVLWTREVLQSYTRVSCTILTSIDEMLRQTSCSSFNSSDGLHMTSCGSALWGQLIIQKMCASGRL